MKQLFIIMSGIFIFTNSVFSQQKHCVQNLILLDSCQANNWESSDSTCTGKNSYVEKRFSIIASNENVFSNKSGQSNQYRMPVLIPQSNHNVRLYEIDSTIQYNLRIVKPE